MADKIILITGATSGVGKAVAFGLAAPNHQLILVARSKPKGEALRQALLEQHPTVKVDLLLADLSLQKDIHALVATFRQRYDQLDVLINCAGLVSSQRRETPEGIEQTLAVNYLSYYLLAMLLAEPLQRARQGRIIHVASLIPPFAKVNFSDLHGKNRYSGVRAYLQSKVAGVMFTYERAEQLKHTRVTVNAVHPGVVRTNLGVETSSGWLQGFVRFCMRFIAISPQQSARRILRLALSPELNAVTGKYFKDGPRPVATNSFSNHPDNRRRLLEVSQLLTKVVSTTR
jgi:NAD(P)-dependent dehydrogenase (short-subunit alcohol dehydrogenase family)